MANQYKSALQHAADELQPQLFNHRIAVLPYMIVWRGITKEIPKGTTKADCRKQLKKFIEASQNLSLDTMLEKQEALL